jgi:hypothetical protein
MATEAFLRISVKIESPQGSIDVLKGMDYTCEGQREYEHKGGLSCTNHPLLLDLLYVAT